MYMFCPGDIFPSVLEEGKLLSLDCSDYYLEIFKVRE